MDSRIGRFVVFAAAAVLILAFPSTALAGEGGHGNAGNPGILPPHSTPNGKSYGEWAAEWWKWAYAIPEDENPVVDPTGEYADVGQSGHVWFLAGTFGGDPVVRECEVPAGKALFFPIINLVWVTVPGEEWDEEFARELLAWILDFAEDLSCEIDGEPVQNIERYRVQSPVFTVDLPEGNVLGLDPGEYGPCVDDGYYLMLAPLCCGEHTIHFQGGVWVPEWQWGFSLDVTYHLTVVSGAD